uniref:Mitochondrial pyruvate carrier n=1 Tax=Meloidogyne incognita TaxID=6306 RepID=A0A914MSQ9_MELIC
MTAIPSTIYRALCRLGDKLIYPILPSFAKPAWNHPAGPKTVFFWSPTIKWVLVGAGISDLTRPASKLSINQASDWSKPTGRRSKQNASLAATGAVWTRYCFVIVPKNYYLASVNFFVFCTGMVQILRIGHYRYIIQPTLEENDELKKISN